MIEIKSSRRQRHTKGCRAEEEEEDFDQLTWEMVLHVEYDHTRRIYTIYSENRKSKKKKKKKLFMSRLSHFTPNGGG
jgi:hypothetical protein